jgi:hypothetical protein
VEHGDELPALLLQAVAFSPSAKPSGDSSSATRGDSDDDDDDDDDADADGF